MRTMKSIKAARLQQVITNDFFELVYLVGICKQSYADGERGYSATRKEMAILLARLRTLIARMKVVNKKCVLTMQAVLNVNVEYLNK